jgi:uncharacterized membrane protein YdjX (TVP38/TMEM64 family)
VQKLLRPLLLLAIVLLVPIVPFLLFGGRLESFVEHRLEQQSHSGVMGALVVGLLATDILLPIPSSLVSTIGGARLGWFAGTGASWLGMSLGAALGFAIARRWGRTVALWLTRESELDRMQQAAETWGTLVLVLTRALPVVAEASVLLFGVHRLPWRKFLPPVLLSNLGISLAYSAFGDWAQQQAWLPLALGVSVALPFFVAMLLHRYLSRR